MAHQHSSFTTTRALTYSYVHIPPQAPNNQYILFLHGFPSTSQCWRHQISFFAAKGYGILAPDLLGFGATSKPLELEMYSGKGMASDIIEILCAEGVDKVVGVAHDWGSFLLSRLANYYPEHFSAYAFIDHGYAAPGRSLNAEAIQLINNTVQSKLGFSILGYFLFFNEVDAPKLLNENSGSVESLFFTTDNNIKKKYQGAPGGLRTWLTESQTVDLPEYWTPEDHEHFQRTFSVENGGYGPASNWYKAGLCNINEEDEREIPATNLTLTHPTLLIASTEYFITVTINFAQQMRPLAPNLRVETVTGGHWLQLERVNEVNTILNSFLVVASSD